MRFVCSLIVRRAGMMLTLGIASQDIPIVVVGTKMDLVSQSHLTRSEGKELNIGTFAARREASGRSPAR